MHELALCAGNGGLSLGLRLAYPSTRTVCMVEREAFACADLVKKMQAGYLDNAPIWTDCRTFDGKPWRKVKNLVVTAGFPCQPHSYAGRKKGVEDSRWLWEDIHRIIDECQASAVFFENVPGLVRSGLNRILRGLAQSGFDAEWDHFSAGGKKGVGAPHVRNRFFLLATHPDRFPVWEECGGAKSGQRSPKPGNDGENRKVSNPYSPFGETGNRGDRKPKDNISDPNGGGFQRESFDASNDGKRQARGDNTNRCDDTMGHPDGAGLQKRQSIGTNPREEFASFVRTGWPPGPNGNWENVPEYLLPAIKAKSSFRGMDDGAAAWMDRNQRLRSIGNGVVPLVVAYAFRTLANRAGGKL